MSFINPQQQNHHQMTSRKQKPKYKVSLKKKQNNVCVVEMVGWKDGRERERFPFEDYFWHFFSVVFSRLSSLFVCFNRTFRPAFPEIFPPPPRELKNLCYVIINIMMIKTGVSFVLLIFLLCGLYLKWKLKKKISISKRDMNEKLVNFWRSFLVKKKLQ